jgi:peptidoglycan/LPS O-acetylase OafA/YrhL
MLNVIGHDNRLVFQYSTIFLQGILLFLIKTNRMNAKIGTLLIGVCVVTTAYLHSIDISIATALTALCIHYVEVNHKRVNQFGDISYSLYLTHGLIGGHLLYFFSPHFPSFSARVVLVIIALIASFLFSYLFWRFIENPSRQLSKKITVAPLEGTTNP